MLAKIQLHNPLSPLLFNIIADISAILLKRRRDDVKINGVVPHLVNVCLSILQYADDTIVLMKNDLSKTCNMKLLICAFEQLSDLKINFHKS